MAVAERELTRPFHKDNPTTEQAASEEFTPQPYRWTREQFYTMGEEGQFDGQHVILMEGEIVAMPPMKAPRQTAVSLAAEAIRVAFGTEFFVREQGPFDIGEVTDPEPDVAVIGGTIRDFADRHPRQAVLIVEVSDATLAYDRLQKASLYAKAGVLDYWIINVRARQIEVHRHPREDAAQPFGFGYAEVTAYGPEAVIQPLAASQPVAVSALLP